MGTIFSYIIPLVILLGLLIFVHELGHFLVAKYFKVRVEVFSLGFGKKLLSFRRGETEYCVAAIPLGGYVKMFGDDPSATVSDADRAGSFLHKPVSQRIAIVLAGPLMNLLFAFVIYASISMVGEKALFPGVGDIAPETAAWDSGFRPGDTILEINERPIKSWTDVEKAIQKSPGSEIRFGIQREDSSVATVRATPKLIPNPNVLSLDREIGEIEGLTFMSRAAAAAIRTDTPAFAAGLRSGDNIVAVNGTQIRRWRELEHGILGFLKQGRTLQLTVQRGLISSFDLDGDPATEGLPKSLELSIEVPTNLDISTGQNALAGLGFDNPELYLASIEKDSPAQKAGLAVGDRLVTINGTTVARFEDVVGIIRRFDGSKPLEFSILRGGKQIEITVSPNPKKRMNSMGQEETRYEVGIRPMIVDDLPQTVQVTASNFVEAFERGAIRSAENSAMIVIGLVRLFQGRVSSKNVGGFLSIGQMAKKSWGMGFSEFFMAMAMISLNLFILNLLPVPVLDGGHLVFYSIEAIRGAPLSMKKMELAQRVGAALLVGLMVFALFNDVSRLFFR